MKTLKIMERTVLERTGFRKYPYKEVTQISIFYGGEEFSNHYERVDNPRLRVKFKEVLNTRKKSELEAYIDTFAKSNSDANKWKKSILKNILGGK